MYAIRSYYALDGLADTSLQVLKLNYPDHPSLQSGQFVPLEEEDDNRSWLGRATLGLLDRAPPLPPGETRATQDIQRMYEESRQEIRTELKQGEEAREDVEAADRKPKRAWWNPMRLFD